MNRLLLVVLLSSIGLAACSKKEEVAASAAPSVVIAPSAATAAAPNTGKVLQTQEAGGYTYAEVDTGGGQKVWIAGGPIKVKAGDSVQWGEYAVMRNFNSKSLGRTFDQILFVNSWAPVGGAVGQVAPHGTMPAKQAAQAPAAPNGPQQADAGSADNQGEVKSVTAAGGYTYLEVNQGGNVVWVAAPETAVKAGDKVRWEGGSVMQNFTAKSLNRTFDSIIFAGKAEKVQ